MTLRYNTNTIVYSQPRYRGKGKGDWFQPIATWLLRHTIIITERCLDTAMTRTYVSGGTCLAYRTHNGSAGNTGSISGEVGLQVGLKDGLTITDKLKINDLIILSSTYGHSLRYMHVFRIMQNVQEKFVSGRLHVLISF